MTRGASPDSNWRRCCAGNHRTFAAVFRCKPFRYVYPAPASTVLVNGGSLVNPGNVDAEPVITLTGSGDVTLTIGDKSVDIALPSTATTIIIDVPAGFAYSADGTVNMTGLLSIDDWPLTIPPGTSAVAWTGTVSAGVDPCATGGMSDG